MPSFHYHHLHLPHYHADNDRDLRMLYLGRALINASSSLVLFFLPLFVFEVGQTLEWFAVSDFSPFQKGMLAVVGYHVIARVVSLVSTLPMVMLTLRKGIRFSLLLAHFFFLLQLTLYSQATINPWLLVVAAISHGLFVPHYWLPHHLLLSTKAHVSKMGKDLGLLQFMLELSRVLTPAVGGIIVVMLGYPSLFGVGVLLVLMSVVVTLFMGIIKLKTRISLADLRQFAQLPLIKRQSLTFVGRYLYDALIALWPIYVLLLLGAVDKVGYLYSFSLLLALLLSLVIGAYLDHNKSKRSFFLSGGALGAVWLGRILAVTPLSVGIVDMLDKLVSQFHWLFYDFLLYRSSKANATLLYFVYRELVISVAAVVVWVAIGLAVIFIANTWQALFSLAAVGVIVSTLMTDKMSPSYDQEE